MLKDKDEHVKKIFGLDKTLFSMSGLVICPGSYKKTKKNGYQRQMTKLRKDAMRGIL